jgi:hypothetical protein
MTRISRLSTFCTLCAAAFLRSQAQELENLYHLSKTSFGSHVEYHELRIPKGTEATVADLKGPGKVTYWYITDNSDGKWYPGLVLKVFWDDEPQPSILVPLADFFGAIGGKTVDYQSAPMQINHLSYMCWLPMPFAKRARFALANDGDRDYSQVVAYGIDYEQGREFSSEPARLHCAWHRSNPTQQALHTILEARGHGHYVGNFLQVHSNYRGWWGEGDTIFQIDGKAITHTPGTEDEYGSCWGFGPLYSHPTLGHVQDEKGDNRMYRWYLANPVRFGESLKVQIQDQRWENRQIPSRDDFISVAFWYQVEPHQAITLQPFAERTAASRAAQYNQ